MFDIYIILAGYIKLQNYCNLFNYLVNSDLLFDIILF